MMDHESCATIRTFVTHLLVSYFHQRLSRCMKMYNDQRAPDSNSKIVLYPSIVIYILRILDYIITRIVGRNLSYNTSTDHLSMEKIVPLQTKLI